MKKIVFKLLFSMALLGLVQSSFASVRPGCLYGPSPNGPFIYNTDLEAATSIMAPFSKIWNTSTAQYQGCGDAVTTAGLWLANNGPTRYDAGQFRFTERDRTCPANATLNTFLGSCSCNSGFQEDARHTSCYAVGSVAAMVDKSSENSCVVTPHPLHPLNGNKTKTVSSGMAVGDSELVFQYDSAPIFKASTGLPTITSSMGQLWGHTLNKKLVIGTGGFSILVANGNKVTESARVVSAMNAPTVYQIDSTSGNKLVDGGVGNGYTRTLVASGSSEHYNDAGQLITQTNSAGQVTTYNYDATSGLLKSVVDNNGRSLSFTYTAGLLTSVTNAAAQVVSLAYDAAGNLKTVAWPDAKVLTFVYENASFPWALTGIVDENGARTQTYSYDAQGHAMHSELAGGVDAYTISPYATAPQVSSTLSTVDAITGLPTKTFAWTAPSAVTLTGPNGQSSVLTSASVNGSNAITTSTQPAGSGCTASSSSLAYDANGNLISNDDFDGNRTCYAYDSQNREVTRVEGLSTSAVCSTLTAVGATLPASARKFTTSYHPVWSLATQVTGPVSRVTTIFNGQADPYNANAVAACASAGAVLPCKVITEALKNGAIDATVPAVVNQATYDTAGRLVTSTDTLGHVTSMGYYVATSFTAGVGHTLGDLQTITAPNGAVTTFNSYDKLGNLLQATDPKGIVTTTTYSSRNQVNTITVTAPGKPAQTTSFTYDNAGQLIGSTLPDGSTLAMSYDAAHRLIGATDSKGNSVAYTLDNAGNRIADQVKYPSGAVERSVTRVFDSLNRLQQVTGALK